MYSYVVFLHCKALRTAMYKRYINSIIIIIIIIIINALYQSPVYTPFPPKLHCQCRQNTTLGTSLCKNAGYAPDTARYSLKA